LNQIREREDIKIVRILFILASFLSWFKTMPYPYLILFILASFLSWFRKKLKEKMLFVLNQERKDFRIVRI